VQGARRGRGAAARARARGRVPERAGGVAPQGGAGLAGVDAAGDARGAGGAGGESVADGVFEGLEGWRCRAVSVESECGGEGVGGGGRYG